jgi:hypothetical protein
MQASDIPAKFNVPFANAAGGGYVRAIPAASQIGIVDGAASLADGFPPDTFTAVAAGGVPPFGQDFNGILKQITAWSRWMSAGGRVAWDSAFSAAVGGYPQGAIVGSPVTLGLCWLSMTDNNVTNPDTGGAGWARWPLSRTKEVLSSDLSDTGVSAGTYAGATVVVGLDGRVTSAAAVAYGPLVAANSWAAQQTMPSVRLSSGARGSGDGARAVNLNDFSGSFASSGWRQLPDGFIQQWLYVNVPAPSSVVASLPIAFPGGFLGCVVSYQASVPPNTGNIGAEPFSSSQVKVTNTAPSGGNDVIVWAWGA